MIVPRTRIGSRIPRRELECLGRGPDAERRDSAPHRVVRDATGAVAVRVGLDDEHDPNAGPGLPADHGQVVVIASRSISAQTRYALTVAR
jgi:hypothetical protein